MVLGLTAMLALAGALNDAALFTMPNYSFASPDIGTNSPYAAPVLESWQSRPSLPGIIPPILAARRWAYLVQALFT